MSEMPMTTRNISLPKALKAFGEAQVQSGHGPQLMTIYVPLSVIIGFDESTTGWRLGGLSKIWKAVSKIFSQRNIGK